MSKFIGFFKGMEYGGTDDEYEEFDLYLSYKNKIPKDKIIKHIESLDFGLAPSTIFPKDIFTKKRIGEHRGIADDGDYILPIDLIYYLKNYDIGVPPDYEEYLISIGVK